MNDMSPPRPERQPVFNLPMVVVVAIAVLVGIQAIREYLVEPATETWIVFAFAFIPARITAPDVVGAVLPGGTGAELWSFVTYAFLHADWSHVAFNCLWLAAFGSPLAWRFGPSRFLLFSTAGAIAGAALHLALHAGDMTPLVGASAAISAHMAGATRFVFAAGGPLGGIGGAGPRAYLRPAAPLAEILRDSRVIIFLAAWFGLNFVFGLLGPETGLASGAIAWEAHIGGFLVGLFAFPFFDPIAPSGVGRA
jgi:membrane associated rhomboid family serine protease